MNAVKNTKNYLYGVGLYLFLWENKISALSLLVSIFNGVEMPGKRTDLDAVPSSARAPFLFLLYSQNVLWIYCRPGQIH